MNRKSLFGRLTASTIVSRIAERQDYLRLHLEPLEQRQILTATTYANDNWYDLSSTNGTVQLNDTVVNLNDTINPGGISKTYGLDAFGRVTSYSGGATSNTTVAGAG